MEWPRPQAGSLVEKAHHEDLMRAGKSGLILRLPARSQGQIFQPVIHRASAVLMAMLAMLFGLYP